MPDDPQKPDSLGDDRTFTSEPDAPQEEQQSLGDAGTHGGGMDSSISDLEPGGQAVDSNLPLIDLAARFEIEGELGKGGMGAVQLATDRQLKRKVAIKRIHTSSPSALARFVTEAQSIAALNHFNIVQVYEFGRDDEGPLLIMEYVSGGSLLDRLKEGKLEVEDAIGITCQLCDALAVAHEQGIIHRDIKPANILLTTRGEPKLTDFGLARQESVDHGQTQEGAVLGTIDFMPLEQRRDATSVDARSDLWSLAATAYQMLTGDIPRVIDLDAIPRNLRSMFVTALKQNPDERFSSAQQFKAELRKGMATVVSDVATPAAPHLVAGICPSCNTANETSRKFCRGCRARLIEPCLSCESDNPVWEDVCGECGSSQQEERVHIQTAAAEKAAAEEAAAAAAEEAAAEEAAAAAAEKAVAEKAGSEEAATAAAEKAAAEKAGSEEAATAAAEIASAEKATANAAAKKAMAEKTAVTLKGHSDYVRSVSFSPDGRQIVSGSEDETLKVWDAETGQEMLTLKGHSGYVIGVAFSPDGRRIVSGSDDMTLKVWDAETGQEIRTLGGHSDYVTSVAFSPDGRRIVSGSEDNTLKVWDAETGQEKLTLEGHSDSIWTVCFSPDGKRVISSGGTQVKVWDSKTGQLVFALKGHSRFLMKQLIFSVAYSPDGKLIVSGSEDNTLKIWNADTGQKILTLKGHLSSVESVAFNSDGTRVVSGSDDHTLKIWDIEYGQEILTLEGHLEPVNDVAYSPDGTRIVSGSDDNNLKIWDIPAFERKDLDLPNETSRVGKTTVDNDAEEVVLKNIVTLERKGLDLPNETSRVGKTTVDNDAKEVVLKNSVTLEGHSDHVRCVAFSPDGNRIVSGSADNTLKIWDSKTGKEISTLKGPSSVLHMNCITSVVFSSNGKQIVNGNSRKTLKTWDVETGQEILTLKGHSNDVNSVVFSPDGKRIISGSSDHTLMIWDAETGQGILILEGHSDDVNSVACSLDGKRIASGSLDNTLKVWDAETGQEIITFQGHESYVNSVAYSPDGTQVVSGSADNTLKIWDVETGQEILVLEGHESYVTSVAFSPDGTQIVSGSGGIIDSEIMVTEPGLGRILPRQHGSKCDKVLKIWDAETGHEMLSLEGHSDDVASVAFSPDGMRIVSGSNDKTVKIWDISPLIAGEGN
jgi:WD40 repeat protein/tRNA A-37 threonylcarbamoyl transferase component Bud32